MRLATIRTADGRTRAVRVDAEEPRRRGFQRRRPAFGSAASAGEITKLIETDSRTYGEIVKRAKILLD